MTEKLKRFPLTEPKEVYRCSIFSLLERQATSHSGEHERRVFTLTCPDWVNVVPLTAQGEVILVEQHRFGIDSFTLETPGGAVDPSEKDLTMAALRELEEETGLTSQRLLALPGYPPNPAMQNNKITYFVAFDVQPLQKKIEFHDPFEVIKLHSVPFDDALHMARTGQIANALCALALLLTEPLFKSRFQR